MNSGMFRRWLADQGCRFDKHEGETRGRGPAVVTVHREGRTAELPLVGSRRPIDPDTVRAICEALDIDWAGLPGPRSRV